MDFKNLYEKPRKDFEKKSNEEKFMYLFDALDELEDKIDSFDEGCTNCCCDENQEWIEKIKFEQNLFLERIENLEYDLQILEEKLKKVLKNKWPEQS